MSAYFYIYNNEIIGLKIDNYNISKRMMSNLDLVCPVLSSIKCTKCIESFLDENNEIINWSSLKSIEDFIDVLKLMNKYNITSNTDIFLRPINKKYMSSIDNKINISSYWREKPVRGTRAILSSSGELLGLVRYFSEGDKSIYISMIEIFQKNRGVGSKVVKYILSSSNIGVHGISYDSALSFWLKLGAKVDTKDNHFSLFKE